MRNVAQLTQLPPLSSIFHPGCGASVTVRDDKDGPTQPGFHTGWVPKAGLPAEYGLTPPLTELKKMFDTLRVPGKAGRIPPRLRHRPSVGSTVFTYSVSDSRIKYHSG